jgi:hypothetical protein
MRMKTPEPAAIAVANHKSPDGFFDVKDTKADITPTIVRIGARQHEKNATITQVPPPGPPNRKFET